MELKPCIIAMIWLVTPKVVPRHNWSPQTIYGKLCAVDGPPDQLWMVRFATSGPPAENQLMVEINRGWQHHLI